MIIHYEKPEVGYYLKRGVQWVVILFEVYYLKVHKLRSIRRFDTTFSKNYNGFYLKSLLIIIQ
jgi:hypothetical protein